MKSEEAELLPGREVGGYLLERQLGAGGFGRVYLASREGRPCALKFLRLEHVGSWGWRELFVLLPVQLPHVVRLRGHFQWPEDSPDYLVLVMEYVPGATLYAWAHAHPPSAREVLEKLLPLGHALAALHARGVFHRDLKGDNVLVREPDGAPVLVDFGAGTIPHAPRVTRGALPPASLRYRSPESLAFILRRHTTPFPRYRYTAADELYALGVMLYVLLTGEYPFDGPEEELLDAIRGGHPLPPHECNPRVPEPLSRLCLELMSLEPQERPSDARVLCESLEKLLREFQGQPRWERPLRLEWNEDEPTTEEEVTREEFSDSKLLTVPRSGWRHRVLPALLVLAVGLVLGLQDRAPSSEHETPPTPETAWTGQGVEAGMGRVAPPSLSPNQKRAPCTEGLEREVSGGCWLPIERTASACPPQTVPYEGRCLLRVARPPVVPVSADAGAAPPSAFGPRPYGE